MTELDDVDGFLRRFTRVPVPPDGRRAAAVAIVVSERDGERGIGSG
ncbi:MAG TPA: hypothetical protein VJT49_33795 [Amycolatopsis sp.]|nr:hypothetical protein [Amycolatopsis sp.]HKS49999.1 hypothetical protein [Amycolatopsis sp.]